MTATQKETGEGAARDRARPAGVSYDLTLFINGASARSAHAITDVRSLCDAHLRGRFHLDVVDVTHDPALVKRCGVLATPTLYKAKPLPARMLVGDLSDAWRVLAALGIRSTDSTVAIK